VPRCIEGLEAKTKCRLRFGLGPGNDRLYECRQLAGRVERLTLLVTDEVSADSFSCKNRALAEWQETCFDYYVISGQVSWARVAVLGAQWRTTLKVGVPLLFPDRGKKCIPCILLNF
jgi:hypothetical protein